MGKRRSRRKAVAKAAPPKLEHEFDCPFCYSIKSVGINIKRKDQVAVLACRECQTMYETGITPLEEAVDVYSNWIDSCEEINSPSKASQPLPDHTGVLPGNLDLTPGRNVSGLIQHAKRWKIQPESTLSGQPTAVPTANNKKKAVSGEGGTRRRSNTGRLSNAQGRRRTGRESLEISEEEDEEDEAGLSIEEDEEEEEEWPDEEIDTETIGQTQPMGGQEDQEIEVDELYDESGISASKVNGDKKNHQAPDEDDDEEEEEEEDDDGGGRLRPSHDAWDDADD